MMKVMTNSAEVRRLLGQCFFIGFDGLELPPSISKFIQENTIGGVTLFANNYESPAQTAELINSIQALKAPHDPPLVIAIDHEGGKVQRFKKPFTRFPEARTIAEENSPKLIFECAQIMGKELRAVGVNVNYAPVADINTNPSNPIIGRRAFGETEEQVSKMVTAFVRGLITSGIQPVVKHFPGHGDTSQDSHFRLPKVKASLDMLLKRELAPFLKAFKSHCDLVMTAHIIVESVEPKLPATLSKKILQGILRDQLHYSGLIISDDMEMRAITDHFGEIEAPLLALASGVDILLYHTEPFETRVFENMLSKLTAQEGKEALESLRVSSQKLNEFKKKNFLPYKPIYIPEIEAQIGTPEHLAFVKKFETVQA